MIRDILTKLDAHWVKIPVILYGIGFLIHNFYLSKYSTFEEDILQTTFVYTGTMALIFISVLLVLIVLRLDFADPSSNFKLKRFLPWLARFSILCVVVYTLVTSDYVIVQGKLAIFFGTSLTKFTNQFLVAISWFYIPMFSFYVFVGTIPSESLPIRILRWFYGALSVPLLVLIYFAASDNLVLSGISQFLFMSYLWVLLNMADLSDLQQGIITRVTPLRSSNDRLSQRTGQLIDFARFIVFGILVLHSYAVNLHPNIPQNYGGARPLRATVITQRDTLECSVLNQGSTWLLISKTDTLLQKIDMRDVKRIQFRR